MVVVRGLGLLTVEADHTTWYVPGKAVPLLGGLLACDAHKRPVSRTRLAGLLWPEASESQGRSALTRTLSHFRQHLPSKLSSLLTVGKEELGLHNVEVDSEMFEGLAKMERPEHWAQAIDMYRGRWLAELDSLEVELQREHLHQSYIHLLSKLTTHYFQEGQHSEAIPYLHRWIAEASYEEEPWREAMKLYARLGHTSTALWLYRRLQQVFHNELELEPSQATQQLARSIEMEHKHSSSSPDYWVGRTEERASILRHAQQVFHDEMKLVLVEGPPGIGKTYLLNNLMDSLQWRDFLVASGTGEDLHGNTPYHPWESLLQSLLSSERWGEIQHQLQPATLAQLQGMLQHSQSLEPSTSIRSSVTSLAPALHELLSLVATRSAPLALLFDDVQWAQPSFWDLLNEWLSYLTQTPVLILLSYRSQEMRQSSSWEHIQNLDLKYNPQRFKLTGLSMQETEALLQHEAKGKRKLSKELMETLLEQTQGNPLHLVEIAHEWKSVERSTIKKLIQTRFASLSESAQEAIEVAAVLGSTLTTERWQALVDFPLQSVLPALLGTRFVKSDNHGYYITNDTTRQTLYKTMSKAKRVQRHGEVVVLLQQAGAAPEELLWHLLQAERWNEALNACQQAMSAAAKIHAYASAQSLAKQGLGLLKHLPPNPEAQWDLLHNPLYFWGDPRGKSDLAETVAQLQELLPQLSKHDPRQFQTYRLGALVHNEQGNKKEAIALLQKALQLPGLHSDSHNHRRISGQLGQLYRSNGQFQLAKDMFEHALDIEDSDPALERALRNSYALVWLSAYHCEQAKEQLMQLLPDDFEHSNDRFVAAVCENLTETALLQSRPGDGWPYCNFTLETAKNVHNHRSIASSSTHACQLFLQMGQWHEAETYLLQAEQFAKPIQEPLLQSTVCYSRSLFHSAQHQWSEALELCRQALDYYDEQPPIDESIRLHWNLGYLGLKVGDFTQVQSSADYLLQQHDSFLASGVRAMGELLQAGLTDAQNDSKQTHKHLQRALDLAKLWPTSPKFWSMLEELAQKHATQLVPLCRNAAVQHLQNTLTSLEPYPEWRATFAQRDEVQRLLSHTSSRVSVELVRTDVPLGKRLTSDDYDTVYLTLDAGEQDEQLRKSQGKAGLRRHRIMRMVEEAKAQGTLCNDPILAELLDVSVRTIERDMSTLRKQGHTLPTRRRSES